MNVWQTCLELRARLQALRWPYGSKGLVFGRQVYVLKDTPNQDELPGAWPFAMIFPGPGSADQDDRRLEERSITVVVGQMQEGDSLGEQIVTGGPRVNSDIGISEGRSPMEIAAEVKRLVGEMESDDGFSIQYSHDGTQQMAAVGDVAHLGLLPIRFRAICTSELHLQSPQNVEESGGTATWLGVDQRWGFVTYMVSDAPVSPEDTAPGSEIGRTTGTSLPVPGRPVYVYAGYSLTGGAAVDLWSPDVVGSWRT